jgi:tripartite-type tricarboxylate transporter receptor subunit TctC
VLASAEMQKKLQDLGVVYNQFTQAEYAALVAKQIQEWQPIIKNSGVKM